MITLSHEEEVLRAVSVRLADLLDELERQLLHYMEFQVPEQAMLTACWIANTYTFEKFRYCGYLALRSSLPQCGKSRLLRLIALGSKGNPRVITIPTAAVLLRSGGQVIIIDEADRLTNRDKEMQGMLIAVLNSGFERGGLVPRSVKGGGKKEKGEEWVVKEYPTYGPKAFAGVEKLTDTLSDRTFTIVLNRTSSRKPRLNERRLGDLLTTIRNELQGWADRNESKISAEYEALPDELPELIGLDDRLQDIAEPLLVLAKLADEERPDGPFVTPRLLEGIRTAAKRRAFVERALLPRTLFEIIESLLGASERKFISSKNLLETCRRCGELMGIRSTKGLSSLLKRFGLCPRESPDGMCRGYMLTKEWLEDHRASVG
ncbi:MAG: DUF3631 domain-containing protein [Nitrospira sp.]|nr:DUF3631 domain-containing protein [Nitrospira sp.]